MYNTKKNNKLSIFFFYNKITDDQDLPKYIYRNKL